MHHIGVGRAHQTHQVFLVIDSREVIVTDLITGENLSENKIEPAGTYWPKTTSPAQILGICNDPSRVRLSSMTRHINSVGMTGFEPAVSWPVPNA